MEGSSSSSGMDLDESLYSRQLYVLGREAMINLSQSDVLISGVGGLGVEIAKNLILGGVRSVTLHDTEGVSLFDMSSQFYLSETQIEAEATINRGDASLPKLARLNDHVRVEVSAEPSLQALLDAAQFHVVVLTETLEMDPNELIRLAQACRDRDTCFIMADTAGVFARVFCDFGPNFIITDPEAKEPEELVLESLSMKAMSEKPLISCVVQKLRHGLREGDHVKFWSVSESSSRTLGRVIQIEGVCITVKPVEAKAKTKTDLDLDILSGGGFITKVTMPVEVKFDDLPTALENPNPKILVVDESKRNNAAQLHTSFRALHAYYTEEKKDQDRDVSFVRVPIEVDKFLGHHSKFGSTTNFDEEFARKFARGCCGNLSPLNAFIGGFVAQEVFKACTRKFIPLQQWLYYDAVECLPASPDSDSEVCSIESIPGRYFGQTSCLGPQAQTRLANLRVFIVGAGAIGCELLKNFAMMGIGTGTDGQITVTDMDSIELSNLNRQFLFHREDVGKFKSITAAKAVRAMNPGVNIVAQSNQLRRNSADDKTEDTGEVFDETFFKGLDLVVSALDNVTAREYLDEKGVECLVPFFDAGTFGTVGSTQVCLPGLTKTYRCTKNPKPDQESFPMCTLKYFPYQIHHTLLWARNLFEELFVDPAKNFKGYEAETDGQRTADIDRKLIAVHKLLESWPTTFEDCIRWAVQRWTSLFRDEILQLVHTFPENALTPQGRRFWSPPKVYPTALKFDHANFGEASPTHEFVYAAACLRAQMFGIFVQEDMTTKKDVIGIANIIWGQVLEFVPSKEIDPEIYINEGRPSTVEMVAPEEARLQQMVAEIWTKLQSLKETGSIARVQELVFEKDDDTNHHMDFITAASNCRARNYHIQEADKLKSKLIAGRIAPAIATTTSVVAGLISMEIYKLCQRQTQSGAESHDLSIFRNTYLNLAIPMVILSQPSAARVRQWKEHSWTVWDRFTIRPQAEIMTMKQLLDHFLTEHGLEVCIVSWDEYNLYNEYGFYGNEEEKETVLGLTVPEVIEKVTGTQKSGSGSGADHLVLCILCSNVDPDVDVPPVWYYL